MPKTLNEATKTPVESAVRMLDDYELSVSAPKVLKDLQDTLNKYQGTPPSPNQLLEKTRMPGSTDDKDPSLEKLLKDSQNQQAVSTLKTTLGTILTPTQATQKAQEKLLADFKADCQLLTQWADENPPKIRIQDVPAQLARLQKSTMVALEAHQKTQETEIKANFTTAQQNGTLNQNIRDAFGVDEAGATALEKHLLAEAEKTTAAQHDEFKKSLDKIQEQISQHLQQERARIAYLHTVSAAHEALSKEIQEKAAKQQLNISGTMIGSGQAIRASKYRGVSPDECTSIVTLMGSGITKKGEEYQIVSPGAFDQVTSGFKSFFGGDNRADSDLLSLVAFFRTKNCDRITLTIFNCEDREEAVAYAQRCYKAAQLCGYTDEQINVVWPNTDNKDKKEEKEVLIGEDVKDKSDKKAPRIKPDEKVFKGADTSKKDDLLATIQRKGEQVRKELKASISSHKSTRELKDEFDALKAGQPGGPVAINVQPGGQQGPQGAPVAINVQPPKDGGGNSQPSR